MAQNNNKYTGTNIGLNSVQTNKSPISETDVNNNTTQFVLAMQTLYSYLASVNPTTGLGLLAGRDFKNRGLKGENLALTQNTLSSSNQATPITITQTAGAFTNIGGTLTFKIDNPSKLATVISFVPQITNNTFAPLAIPYVMKNIVVSTFIKIDLASTVRTQVKTQTLKFIGHRQGASVTQITLPKQTIRVNSQNLTSFYVDVDILLTNYTINESKTMTVSILKDQVQIEYYNEII
jgi:hypothetical protein